MSSRFVNLSKKIRAVVAEHIGSPFFAGVPDRDFLICWSANGDQDLQEKMRQQVSADFDAQPYPLCRFPLEVSADGEITISEPSTPNALAANAQLN